MGRKLRVQVQHVVDDIVAMKKAGMVRTEIVRVLIDEAVPWDTINAALNYCERKHIVTPRRVIPVNLPKREEGAADETQEATAGH